MADREPESVWIRAEAEDGSVVTITTTTALAPSVRERWPALGLRLLETDTGNDRDIDRGTDRDVGLHADLEVSLAHLDDLNRFESDLALFAMEHLAHLVAVHAALLVVDGVATIIPGPSHAGKSTLALAAADVGIHVVTDEYVLIDPTTGLVTGVPRPIRRRHDSGVERVPVARPTSPVPVALVAAVTWEGGATSVTEMPAAEIAMTLLANTVCARRRAEDSLAAALAVARSARGVTGSRGEARDTLTLLGLV